MRITDTLSGKKEEFKPIGDVVTMYVCGINPYADAHIGHAMSYIIFDVVRRYLTFRGYKVRHVENVTDVEDNIIATANRLGIPVKELTEKYTQRYFEDMDALNILRADVYPRATEEIPKIIEVVEGLASRGYAYAAGGNVYFRVRRVPDYGKLSRRSLEQMMAGARVEAGEEKEDPMDFVLWKAAKPGEPAWDSPWGKGRPGWHIECSAMSLRYLGEQIDIHGGGQDLVFPHHENEITQSESFTGKKPFVKYWMHNGLLQMGAEKMSKSLGNLITIRDALQKYTADAIRIFILSSYYRSPLTYTEEAIEAAEKGAERLRRAVSRYEASATGTPLDAEPYKQKFLEAMDDDFNTAQAMAALFDIAHDINRADEAGMDARSARETLKELGGILGLSFKAPEAAPLDAVPFAEMSKSIMAKLKRENLEYVLEKVTANPDAGSVDGYLNLLRELRNSLREAKQFQLADEIRNKLTALGITLEDTPQGTVWKRKR
jgi:cysteinyl-tRNA synthetase